MVDYSGLLREIEEDEAFILANGERIRTLAVLADRLKSMPQEEFSNHVNSEKNDFANWITHCFYDELLGQRIFGIQNNSEMAKEIETRLEQAKVSQNMHINEVQNPQPSGEAPPASNEQTVQPEEQQAQEPQPENAPAEQQQEQSPKEQPEQLQIHTEASIAEQHSDAPLEQHPPAEPQQEATPTEQPEAPAEQNAQVQAAENTEQPQQAPVQTQPEEQAPQQENITQPEQLMETPGQPEPEVAESSDDLDDGLDEGLDDDLEEGLGETPTEPQAAPVEQIQPQEQQVPLEQPQAEPTYELNQTAEQAPQENASQQEQPQPQEQPQAQSTEQSDDLDVDDDLDEDLEETPEETQTPPMEHTPEIAPQEPKTPETAEIKSEIKPISELPDIEEPSEQLQPEPPQTVQPQIHLEEQAVAQKADEHIEEAKQPEPTPIETPEEPQTIAPGPSDEDKRILNSDNKELPAEEKFKKFKLLKDTKTEEKPDIQELSEEDRMLLQTDNKKLSAKQIFKKLKLQRETSKKSTEIKQEKKEEKILKPEEASEAPVDLLNISDAEFNTLIGVNPEEQFVALVSTEDRIEIEKRKRLKTGVPGFDELVDEGIPHGSSILVSGGPGSGKTTFCIQQLGWAAEHGEKCLFISLEEKEERLIEHMKGYGLNPEKYLKNQNLKIKKLDSFKLSRAVEALLAKARGELMIDVNPIMDIIPSDYKPDRIVLDSLSAVAAAFAGQPEVYRIYVEQLFNIFGDLGVTSFIITEIHGSEASGHGGVEDFLADGVINFYNMKKGTQRQPAIEILKMRGTRHKKKIVPFNFLSGKGIEVYPLEEVFHGD